MSAEFSPVPARPIGSGVRTPLVAALALALALVVLITLVRLIVVS